MGEVYRARDSCLDRTVAVKILFSYLSENPEARKRFDHEARTFRVERGKTRHDINLLLLWQPLAQLEGSPLLERLSTS